MKNYIDALKNYIKENALKMLKDKGNVFSYPFIDPGAGYEGDLWDWDSYWSAYALFDYLEFYKEDENFDYKGLKSTVIEHAMC